MTDQQFYQENLIKILESIKADISEKMEYCKKYPDIPLYSNSISAYKNTLVIVDEYLLKAKAIYEYIHTTDKR